MAPFKWNPANTERVNDTLVEGGTLDENAQTDAPGKWRNYLLPILPRHMFIWTINRFGLASIARIIHAAAHSIDRLLIGQVIDADTTYADVAKGLPKEASSKIQNLTMQDLGAQLFKLINVSNLLLASCPLGKVKNAIDLNLKMSHHMSSALAIKYNRVIFISAMDALYLMQANGTVPKSAIKSKYVKSDVTLNYTSLPSLIILGANGMFGTSLI